MNKTILEFLTIKNPDLDRSSLKKGKVTSLVGVVGPHKTVRWSDFNLDILEQDLITIISRPWLSPKQTIPELEDQWLKLIGEKTVQWDVHNKWNEPIIRQALRETRLQLIADGTEDQPFLNGDISLKCNTGDGDFETLLPDQNKKSGCKPDWHCFQSRLDSENPAMGKTVLLYGETKPSPKFKCTWIESESVQEEAKALRSLEQVTKYLNGKRLRYGFIITDEELVVLRLSRRLRDMSEVNSTQQTGQVSDSVGSQFTTDETARLFAAADYNEIVADPAAFPRKERSVYHLLRKTSRDNWIDEERTVDIVLEWYGIPWEAHGTQSMTVNLGLWTLIMLAVNQPTMDGHELIESQTLSTLNRKRISSQVETIDDGDMQPRRSKRSRRIVNPSFCSIPSGTGSDLVDVSS